MRITTVGRLALTTSLLALALTAVGVAADTLTEERGYDRKGDDYASFRTRALRDCKEACGKDDRCRAYTYDTRNGACYLKSRINSRKADYSMVTGYRETGGYEGGGGEEWAVRGMTQENGYDRRGNDYTSFRARGLRDCVTSCSRDERCQSYTYDTRNGACYLKSRINSKVRNEQMITGYRDSSGNGSGGGGWEGPGGGPGGGNGELTEEWSRDRKGNDYDSYKARSVDACKADCARDRRCRAYTFDTVSSTCYLKDRINSAERANGKVTGYKGGRY